MSKNILEQLEKYVDKIVFVVIGLVCLAMLWFFILSKPYAVEYKGRKLGPGQLDKRVRVDAKELENKMLEPPVVPPLPEPKVGLFAGKLASSVQVAASEYALLPGVGDIAPLDDRSYKRPEIPGITGVAAEWYRTVAHVPTDIVDPVNTYEKVQTEYGDIDIVTVQGTFDMQKLLGNFAESFNPSIGSMLAKYRSEQLASPLFASVELQRQQLTSAGWTQWETVPHTKVDSYAELLENIPDNMTDVEIGGIELLMANYNSPEIQGSILQPAGYEFASNLDTWYPPVLHTEFTKLTKMEREKELDEARRSERGIATRASRRDAVNDEFLFDDGMMQVNPRNRARTDARKGPRTLRDVEMDFDNLLLKDPSQLNTYKQDIVLWAHDDTVVPEGVYRYRMRVGVFNPTAGKGWFDGEDKDYADSVILWSDYTDVTEPVEIDPMIYFFPLDLAKNDESVSIQVSKFSMGNWKSHEFEVLAGQTIGHQVEEEKKKDPLLNDVDMMDPDFGAGFEPKVEPTIVDYTTNATLIDVVDISDWAGASLRARRYSDILYSLDGSDIRRLPTKRTNWPKEMQTKFDQIRSVQDMEVELTTKGHSYKNRYMDMNQDLGMEEFF